MLQITQWPRGSGYDHARLLALDALLGEQHELVVRGVDVLGVQLRLAVAPAPAPQYEEGGHERQSKSTEGVARHR